MERRDGRGRFGRHRVVELAVRRRGLAAGGGAEADERATRGGARAGRAWRGAPLILAGTTRLFPGSRRRPRRQNDTPSASATTGRSRAASRAPREGRAETDRREVRERCALRVCREGCRAESQSLSVLTGRAFSRGRDHQDSAVQPAGRTRTSPFSSVSKQLGNPFLDLQTLKRTPSTRKYKTSARFAPTRDADERSWDETPQRLPRRRRATGCRSRDI